jgi:hypothetical protein
MNFLGALIRRKGWSDAERDAQIAQVLGSKRSYAELSKSEASQLIDAWDDRKK